MSNINFHGWLDIAIPEQVKLSAAQQRMVEDAFNEGKGISPKVRYGCAIAMAVNEVIKDGIMVDGKRWEPNPKVRAQFGKNKKNLPYLTFGLIDEGGNRRTLTWEGAQNIPVEMAAVAVKHDQGKRTKAETIPLSLDNAVVHETGNKDGKGAAKRDRRRNHDTAPNGKAYDRRPRNNHNRMCAEDVKELLLQVAAAARQARKTAAK